VKHLYLVWRNLTRRKVRTAFTFLSIAVAFFLFGLLRTIDAGFSAGVEIAGADRLVTLHKVSIIQPLPIRYLEQIRSVDGVERVAHGTWFGGIYVDTKNFFAQFAVEPGPFLDLYPEYVLPDAQREAWERTRTGAVAGRALAERFGWEIGDRIPIQATIWRPTDGGSDTYEFELVGIYDGTSPNVDETQFWFRHDYLMERLGDLGLVGWYIVRVEDPERSAEVAAAIDSRFANSPYETKTSTEKAFMQAFAKQVGDTTAILSAIVLIVFFVILLIAGNTMAQSVRERVAEVGVLKTLGFTDGRILGLVLAESLLLATGAGLTGLALFSVAVPGLRPLVEQFLPVFFLPPSALASGLVWAVGLGVAAGALPALRAMRLPVAVALRRV